MVMYPVLVSQIAIRGIKQKAIADAMNTSSKTLRNKLYGETAFLLPEAQIIRDRFFPDMSIDELFKRDGLTGQEGGRR